MLKNVVKEELKVPAHIDYLGELRNFVTKTGKKHGFSDSIVNAFKLSIDEAATNIIKHAYRDSKGEITMRIIVKKNSLTVILIDQGKYFDPLRVKNPDLKRYVDIGKKGGLGIFIMKKLIDDIEYRHTEEGNELRFTKFRDGDFKRSRTESIATPSTTSPLSLSLKSRYSLIAAAILTIVVIIGYMYYYFSRNTQVMGEILTRVKSYSQDIARTVVNPDENILSTFYIGTHLKDALDISVHDEIYLVNIVDSDNLCIYSTHEELLYTNFRIPENHKNVLPGIYQYKLENEQKEVFDIVSPINTIDNQKLGETHLIIKNDFVEKKVTAKHKEDLRLAILILLIGYLGITILIYIVMNPFRKLADWVRDLGHGEVKDEIDFDTGDELGEIAKAFSDITDKFRQSQVNLAEQERLQKEMQLAQDIQQTLLPTSVPTIEGYEIATCYEAAKEVGGDYYDFVEVDKDSLGIVVADVSGKGVPGSLIMTMIRTALRTEARGVKSASEVLTRLNKFVEKDMKKGMFVTVFYVIIDAKRRRVNYASAGHNPMILYRPMTEKTYYLNPRGFPVGISLPDLDLFKNSIESDTIQLAEDDVLLIYTDGITEAMNNKRYLFGEERLLDAIRKYSHLRVQPFVEKIRDEIYSFTEGHEQNDDISFVAIKEKSSPEKIELRRAQKAHSVIAKGKNIREACEESGITTYAYYNKYKKIFEEEGMDAYAIDDTISVESKHLSIEEKTKIYDIIKKHPEYGAKRISEELDTEKYGSAKINESRIYDELVRSRLNTRQLREAYVARAGKKHRMKPPGTPMLTLDGRVIIDKIKYEEGFEEEKTEFDKEETTTTITSEEIAKKTETIERKSVDIDDDFMYESLMTVPIQDLLEKKPDTKDISTDEEEFILHEEESTTKKELETVGELLDKDSYVDSSTEEIGLNEPADELIVEDTANDSIPEKSKDVSIDDLFEDIEINEFQDEHIADESSEFSDSPDRKINADILSETNSDVELKKNEKKDEFELDEGLEHDFSFKDIWENEIIELDENDEFEFNEVTNKQQEFELTTEQGAEKTSNGEINFEDLTKTDDKSIYENKDDNGIYEEIIFTTKEDDEADQLSFNDLVDEIEQSISFFDSGREVDDDLLEEEKHISSDKVDEDKLIHLGTQNKESEANDMLKRKYLLLGLRYYKEGNYEKAIEVFERVIEMYPTFKEVHNILGNAYFRNNMSDLAMKEYQRVKVLDPHDVDAYENIGVIYANRGEYSKAISEWEMLLKIDPDRRDIRNNVEKAKYFLEKVKDKA